MSWQLQRRYSWDTSGSSLLSPAHPLRKSTRGRLSVLRSTPGPATTPWLSSFVNLVTWRMLRIRLARRVGGRS